MGREDVNVLLVTSEGACGIAEHSAYLKEAVEPCGVEVTLHTNLDPHSLPLAGPEDVLHLNYHAALHSQWTPEWIRQFQQAGLPVVVTYHDTGVPNSDQAKALHAVADAFVVHEPAVDLPGARYWRQGVPPASSAGFQYGSVGYDKQPTEGCFKAYWDQPVLGSVGFPFPWKNYDLLAAATAEAGWALVLLAPTATAEDVARWQRANPYTLVRTDFVPREAVVAYLAGCDATAFLYTCCNTGTSGAIRQGIAARKPVLASDVSVCRQFRDLDGERAITWVLPDRDHLVDALRDVPIQRVSPIVCALAEQDSWVRLGRRYADLYRQLAGV